MSWWNGPDELIPHIPPSIEIWLGNKMSHNSIGRLQNDRFLLTNVLFNVRLGELDEGDYRKPGAKDSIRKDLKQLGRDELIAAVAETASLGYGGFIFGHPSNPITDMPICSKAQMNAYWKDPENFMDRSTMETGFIKPRKV